MEDKHGNAIEVGADVVFADTDGTWRAGRIRRLHQSDFANVEIAVPAIGGIEVFHTYAHFCEVLVSPNGERVAWVRPGAPDEQTLAAGLPPHHLDELVPGADRT